MGHAVDADSMLGCVGNDGFFRDALLWPERNVCAAAVAGDFNAIAEMLLDGVEQGLAACCVSAAQAAQVALIDAGVDELGEGLLLECCGVKIVEPLGRGEGSGQRFGHDEIADAQSSENGSREGADVDGSAFGIQPL